MPTKEPIVESPPYVVETENAPTVAVAASTGTPSSCFSDHSCSPGQDWSYNCISQQWVIYPFLETSTNTAGCYSQPIWASISTKDSSLYILAQLEHLIATEEYGIFVELPQSATVRMTVDLDLIDNGALWLGIFSRPTVKSNGLVIVAPPGNLKEEAFAVRSTPDQADVDLTERYFSSSATYSLGFDVYPGSVNAVIEDIKREASAFSSPQRWLFIAYRAKLESKNGTVNIEASIKDLEIVNLDR